MMYKPSRHRYNYKCRLCFEIRPYEQLVSHLDSAHGVNLELLKDMELVLSAYQVVSSSDSQP